MYTHHEYPIDVIPATPLWSENFAILFADSKLGASVFYSTGRWHSDPTLWRETIAVALQDGRILYVKNYGRNVLPNGPAASLSRYEVLEPEKTLRLSFDGPMWQSSRQSLITEGAREGVMQRCRMDLMFQAATPLWNMSGDSPEAAAIAGAMHTEQIGRAHGTVRYGDEIFQFNDAYSVRDHSRGVRDATHYYRHLWMSGLFPGGHAFYVYGMQARNTPDRHMANAAVVRDGVLYPAKLEGLDFLSSLDEADRSHHVLITSELGTMTVHVTKVIASVPASFVKPFDTSIGTVRHTSAANFFSNAVELECDGKTGVGWSERGIAAQSL